MTHKYIVPVDPAKQAAMALHEGRSLAELTHIARAGINAMKTHNRLPIGGPPLEYGLEPSEPRTYPPSWAP